MGKRRDAVFRDARSRDVVREILTLHFPDCGSIADLTWGKGAFWFGGEQVVGLDISPRSGCQIRADCRSVPLRSRGVDVVVFDPPFMHGLGSTTSTLQMPHDFGRLRNQKAIRALYFETRLEIHRVARLGAIVKCADTIESGRLNPTHVEVIQQYGWPADIAILDSGVTRPIRPNSRVLHFKPAHSYFLVYRWGPRG